MAVLTIPDEKKEIRDPETITAYLENLDITYEQWEPSVALDERASQAEILSAYAAYIDALKQRGGYTTADVINVDAGTKNLESMLDKFRGEHWHDEDEVRFILSGHGQFHIHPKGGAVVAVRVEAGDLLLIPTGIYHWFDLCEDRQIKAIRLFQNPSGWTPLYTESKLEQRYA